MTPKLRTAVLLSLTAAVISGAANIITKMGVTVVADPVVFTFAKNAIVGIIIAGLLLAVTRLNELRSLTRRQWIRLALIGIIGGSVPFILFFTGLQQTSALTGSFIHKTLFLWVALLAVPFLKERMTPLLGLAFLLLVGGNLALGFPQFTFSRGEGMILAATIFWAVENVLAKRTLRDVSSLTVGAARMVIGSVVLLGVLLAQGKLTILSGLTGEQWIWTIIPSVVLLGFVLAWYTALKYAPATVVASLLVPATLVTNVLSATFLDGTMTVRQLISGALLVAGIVPLLFHLRRRSARQTAPQHA